MRLNISNTGRAILAGVLATLVMTALMMAGKALALETWDVGSLIGSAIAFGQPVTRGDGYWVWGFGLHLFTGMCVFPLLYAHWVWGWLRGPNWLRGFCWAMFLWFLTQALFMPLVGAGFFDMDGVRPIREAAAWLVLLAVYGVLFGALAGSQEIRRLEIQDHADWIAQY